MRKVIKLGSSSLFNGAPKTHVFESIADQVYHLKNQGYDVALVSSAAIAFGRKMIGTNGNEDVATKQALAAVGQPYLMAEWAKAFDRHDVKVGQALLTMGDVYDQDGRNIRIANTFNRLFGMGIVPIVNENDTVANEEIRFGDNDQLAADVARFIGARTLHLLGQVDSLYEDYPVSQRPITSVKRENLLDLEHLAKGSDDMQGTGGMATKLTAAGIFVQGHKQMFIARADLPDVISLAEAGKTGTRFYSHQ